MKKIKIFTLLTMLCNSTISSFSTKHFSFLKKLVVILFVISTIFSSCKKYPEGPLISFRSAEKRLRGDWQIVGFTSNDIDSLKSFNDSCGAKMHINETYRGESDAIAFRGKVELHGYFDLQRDKTTINVSFTDWDNGNTTWHLGPIGKGKSTWKILKLTSRDFKISTTFNSLNYIILFKKT